MRCSLVITTYNWEEALSLVLQSVLNQSVLPEEIIIADDGSNKYTFEIIQEFMKISPINIIHSWQKDDGFRAAQSRNKAISKATTEYIILIDGDMLLHKDFIYDHLKHAEKGYFLQGGRVILDSLTSARLFEQQEVSLWGINVKNKKNNIHSNILSKLFLNKNDSLNGIKTCNMSFYKSDCISINGFNNEFIGWGREDSEFVVRLFNSNIRRKNIKFNAIAYHIWHNENLRTSLPANDLLLLKSINEKLTYCENGLAQV